jgi:dihydroorotate dehydrogenase
LLADPSSPRGGRPHVLPERPDLPDDVVRRVRDDFERFASTGLPPDLEDYLRTVYGLDVAGSYAGFPLKNPWGKASGQLSMRRTQVEEAAAAGLGFVVLKTVIAQDAEGRRTMAAWAIKEARMVAERIVGRDSGASGWTISWKGRGWWLSFAAYLDLVREAVALGRDRAMLVIPSVKYHLPAPGETTWRIEEYAETTRAVLSAYTQGGGPAPMPLEKDFSPTLAGSERSRQRAQILEWLRVTPVLIRAAAAPTAIQVGLKLFNSLDDDAFQLAMLAAVHGPEHPDFVIYANRLFDPDRVFEGHKGIAYGGPDLSDRNLRLLSALRAGQAAGAISRPPLALSGTGDIGSGRLAVEYVLRGCTSLQLHTVLQLPVAAYAMQSGSKLERALHLLYFHPEEGLIVWALHAARRLGLGEPGPVRLLDLAARGAASAVGAGDLDA